MVGDVEPCQLANLVVDGADLGDGDEAVADTEQLQDSQVLL